MVDAFFYGTLCHPPLLAEVLGRRVDLIPAVLPGHAVRQALGPTGPLPFAVLMSAEAGSGAAGAVVRGLDAQDLARIAYYEAGYTAQTVAVQVADAPAMARAWLAEPGRWQPGAPWSLADWQGRWAAVATEAVRDYMAGMGQIAPDQALARYPMLLVRAASRLRARDVRPATLRRAASPLDVAVQDRRLAYARFFAVEDYRLTHRSFDGGQSPVLDRAAFVSCDAVVVLPYDPVTDRVLVVEQFRTGAFARGDLNPWLIEPVAGRIDADETPEAAARREAAEEAGLTLGRLIAGPGYYPSPGAKTEYIYSFVALADLPDTAARLGGMACEGEDIRAHVIAFDRLMALVETGEVNNATLLVLALWLARLRPDLRRA